MISLLSFFIVPTILFVVFIKLNHKYKWLVTDPHYRKNSYIIKKTNEAIDKLVFWFFVIAFFVTWPVMLPIIGLFVFVSFIIKLLLNSKSIIPTDDE